VSGILTQALSFYSGFSGMAPPKGDWMMVKLKNNEPLQDPNPTAARSMISKLSPAGPQTGCSFDITEMN